jgi:hypothetical protein
MEIFPTQARTTTIYAPRLSFTPITRILMISRFCYYIKQVIKALQQISFLYGLN